MNEPILIIKNSNWYVNARLAKKVWNKHNPGDEKRNGDGHCIHHKDGDRNNNGISNLEKMLHGTHTSLHHKGSTRKSHSEETKMKMSLAHIGNTNTLGQKRSDETKRKMSEAHAGERNAFFGKKHSKESRKKMSEISKRSWSERRVVSCQ